MRDTFAPAANLDWTATQLRSASITVIAVALTLAAGLLAGAPQSAVAATTGSQSIGFGASQRLANSAGLPLLLAAIGMGLCTFLGASLSHSSIATACAGSLVAVACGFATQFGEAYWWFTLQWSVAFFLATSMPSGPVWSAERAGLVLAGGLLQIAIIDLGHRLSREQDVPAKPPSERAAPLHFRFALVAGCMTAIAIVIERTFALPNGYWVPMTALIILKPRMQDIARRTLQRVAGTIAGAGAATLLAALLRPAGPALVLTIIIFAWATYAFQRVNYIMFSFGITATVAFMLSLSGLPEPIAAAHRVIATTVGALIAVTAGIAILDLSRGHEPDNISTPPRDV